MRPARDWSLRLARPDDAGGLERLLPAAFDAARLIRRGHSLVSHVDEALAGALLAQPFGRELHVWHLAVAEAYRGRGIGSGLARAAQIDARNTGMKAITLIADREGGAPFFARLGFEEVTALDAHLRLSGELAVEVDGGLDPATRCAMICFLD